MDEREMVDQEAEFVTGMAFALRDLMARRGIEVDVEAVIRGLMEEDEDDTSSGNDAD